MMRWLLLLAIFFPLGCAGHPILFRDDFRKDLSNWIVEQQPGGTVTVVPADGKLIIADEAGCTVWFRHKLEGPLVIRYRATVSSKARVSDLNCFWMATDPRNPANLFAPEHGRDGRFATYDRLQTYYVGQGGNANTTTRFRRYDGTGARPLAREHDLSAREFLLTPDHEYQIELRVDRDGRVQYRCDGRVFFDFLDPAPLRAGWFGFRTVQSRLEISDFVVLRLTP